MTKVTINTISSNGLSNNATAVYAGKSGFNTRFGVIPLTASTYTSSTPYITFNVDNLHLIFDEFFSNSSISSLSNVYIQAPTNQFPSSTFQFGSTGYTNFTSYATLEVRSVSLESNTITVYNKTENGRSIASSILSPPLRLLAFQPKIVDNVAYVYGSDVSVRNKFTVKGNTGVYPIEFKQTPKFRSDIKILVDNSEVTNFIWPVSGNNKLASISLSGEEDLVEYIVNTVTVPAIEANDIISLYSTNSYIVTNTSYQLDSTLTNTTLTNSSIYKVQLNKEFPASSLGGKLVNISPDAEGIVSNVTSNSLEFDFSNTYPYSYSLANNGLYYLYNKNAVTYTQGRLDQYGRLENVPVGNFIVNVHNVSRYNRVSPRVSSLVSVDSIRLPKVTGIDVREEIILDTTTGATINAIVTFDPILGVDVDTYEVIYKVDSSEVLNDTQYSKILVAHNSSVDKISVVINNLTRGRLPGSNTLNLLITPIKGNFRGLSVRYLHSLIGKTEKPNGVRNLNIAQKNQSLLYSWNLILTADGFLQDLDATEIEIREYPQVVDVSNRDSLQAAWGASITIDRIPAKNTSFISPVSKYGTYTYMLRVRDSSNNESDDIAGRVVNIVRPSSIRVFKAYNEGNPSSSFIVQDDLPFPNSNTHPEVKYPSVNDIITNGFVVEGASSNTDNSNGSSIGFSATSNSSVITTGTSTVAEYVTQIRDIGAVINGTVRINPLITIRTPNSTFIGQKEILLSGVTDSHESEGLSESATILVDNAFGGIGHLLGFNNANAATVSYNAYHRTLTSGGAFGNVYAIFNASDSEANANSYALIAGVINANAIVLSNTYHANGNETFSNAFANVTIAGNSYYLVNLLQYGDPVGSVTFFGPESGVSQNIFIRYATDNVFYSAAANGVVGFPNHGNTNPFAFVGAATNSELGFSNFIAGDLEFRYFQIKLTIENKFPTTTEVDLEDFTYEVDVEEKSFRKIVPVTSTLGTTVDYTSTKFILAPSISVTLINSTGSYTTSVSDISNTSCKIIVRDSQNNTTVSTETVSVLAIGI
jgi:hypothetical protein